MIERPFYERYPSQFLEKDGASVFHEDVYVTEDHVKWLSEDYFPIVIGVNRYPRYKNSRSTDIYVKSFLDDIGVEECPDWGLPEPNQEAAYKSLSKYAKDIPAMSEKQVQSMNLAWEWTAQQFLPYMRGSRVRSVDEVIEDLDKTTSSGYPFNNLYSKKKELFEKYPEIRMFLERDWDNLKDSNYCFCFTNSLKEEIRPTVKTLQNKIRTFTAGAVDGTVHGNRLFADMNEKMNAAYLRSSSGVGMSPLKGNWDALYRKLKVFRNGYALDESEYDSSLRAYLMWGCAKLRWECLRPEDQIPENLQRLKVYYRNLVNSLIITPEGVIVMKLGGNPSGSCNTINDNTLILYTLLAYAWIMLCPGEPHYGEFEMNTAKILVGDDNTWTVSDWAHCFYNGKSIISVWNDIGVTTTTDSLEPREAEDLDFLSAKTIFYKGMAIPVYDRTKLMTSLLYAETKSQSPAYTLLRAAALLQIGWSDVQFRRFAREFIQWLLDHFDRVCSEDKDWIQAKSAILTDQRLEDLFLGKSEILYSQSYQESKKDIRKPDKMTSVQITTQKSRSKRGKGAKATRKRGNNRNYQNFMGPLERGPNRSDLFPVLKRQRNRGSRKKRQGRQTGGNGMFPTKSPMGRGGTKNFGTNRRSQLIVEDEFIGAVSGSVAFAATQFSVNIGQAGTFPWASAVAKNYQKYEFDMLEFYYKREVSEFATNGQAGKIMLYFNPDAADPVPTTKQQVEDSDCHADAMPCENFVLRVPPSMLKKMNDAHFIRTAGLIANTDIKTYDVGNLFLCTQGNTNTTEVGELHVRYRCRVSIPVISGLQGGVAPTNNSAAMFQSTTTQAAGASTVNANLLLGTASVNGISAVNTAGSIVLPVGNYSMALSVVPSSTGAETSSTVDIQKNAVSVFTIPQTSTDSVGYQGNPQTVGAIVSSNGTDAFTFPVKMTYASGSPTIQGVLTILAI